MVKHNVLMPIIIKLKVKRDIMKLKSLNIFVLAILIVVGGFFLKTDTALASCDPRYPNTTPPNIDSVNPPTGNYANPGNIPINISGQGGYECVGDPNGGLGNDMVEVSVSYTITNSVGVSMFENTWNATPCWVPICVIRTINVNDNANANTWPAGTYTITAQAMGAGGDSGVVTENFTITRASEPSPMSGTLTPASSTCTIASGASNCAQTLTWTTTNPVAVSAVTNNGTATPASSSGNNSSANFTVPYNTNMGGVTTFYLYNNAQLLATATVTTVCTSGTTWNGLNCGIGVGSSGDTEVTRNNIFPNLDAHVSFLTSGLNQDIVVNHGETTFFLYHNIGGIPTILSQYTINARCADGSVWNGIDRCVENNLPPGDGVCATPPNGGSYTTAPLGPLCSAGTANPSALSGKGDWSWTCAGSDGGSNASCSATQAPAGCASLNAAPTTIYTGGSTKLTWSSCATSCSGTNFDTGGEANNSTGVSVSPAVSTTYVISCNDKSNSTSSINVIVKKKPILLEN